MKLFVMILLLYLAGYAPVHFGVGPQMRRVLGPHYLASLGLCLLAAFVAPNAFLFYGALVVIFAATVRSRQDAICRYVMLSLTVPSINFAIGIGGLYLGTISITLPLSVGLVIAMLIHPAKVANSPDMRGFRVEDALAWAIFAISIFGTSRGAPISGVIRDIVTDSCAFLLPYYLIRSNVRTPEQFQQLVCCLGVAAMSIAMVGFYEVKAGWALFDTVNNRFGSFGAAASVFKRGAYLRASGPFGQPLLYAFSFVIATIAMSCSRAMFASKKIWRSCVLVLLLALVAAQSRGALVAGVPAFLVLLVARRRYAAAAGMLAASGVGGVALFALSGRSSAISSFLGTAESPDGGIHDYRELLLRRGLEEGAKHPILGRPLREVLTSLADITQGEQIVDLVNTYLTFYLTAGLVGLGAFVLLFAWVLRKLIARAPRGTALEAVRAGRAFLLSSITGTLIFIATMSFAERLSFVMLLLIAGAGMTSQALIRRRPRPPAQSPLRARDKAGGLAPAG